MLSFEDFNRRIMRDMETMWAIRAQNQHSDDKSVKRIFEREAKRVAIKKKRSQRVTPEQLNWTRWTAIDDSKHLSDMMI